MKKILRSTFGTLVVAAFLVLTTPIYAEGGHGGHGGHGKHGKHFSAASQRADTRLAEAGRNSAWPDREHIEAGAAVNGAAVTGLAVHGTAVTGAAGTGAAVTGTAVTGTAVTGVGTHIGAGVTLTRTRTTAIILTGTILRTGTSMTTAPYQDGDIFTPDPSVILFRRVTTL